MVRLEIQLLDTEFIKTNWKIGAKDALTKNNSKVLTFTKPQWSFNWIHDCGKIRYKSNIKNLLYNILVDNWCVRDLVKLKLRRRTLNLIKSAKRL